MSTNIAKLLAKEFARNGKPVGVLPATLTKVTPGARTPGAPASGTNPTTQALSALGIVTDYTAFELQNTQIRAGDRKVLLFGASISGGAAPEPTDRIAIDGETLTIVDKGVTRDPAKATYLCQCRR